MIAANTSYKQNGVPVSIPSGSYGIAHLTVHQYEYPKGHPCHNCPYTLRTSVPSCMFPERRVIRQELSGQLKALGNRLAGLINRLTIISAAGYYANIAIIADLIDQDRYSSFEKIESAARKRALAFANQKNADALRTFMDDEEMQKAIHAVQGGSRVDSDL